MEYLSIIIGSGGLLGIAVLIFYMGRMVAKFEARFDSIDRKFDLIDKRFDSIDKRFDKIDVKLEKIGVDIQDVKSRLDRLEVRVEERTLKVVSIQREPHEKVLEHV